MSKRDEHTFQFSAEQIAEAAKNEAEYHEDRVKHWDKRASDALVIVKQTIGAKVVEHQQTNGTYVDVDIDYGNPEAWREYQKATGKAQTHRTKADRFRTDQQVYETQGRSGSMNGSRVYELDTDDVHHFRLGGQERED